MRRIEISVTALLVVMAAGCASTTQYGPKVRAIDYTEASTFERGLIATAPPNPQRPIPSLFTQPVNKKEPCKLPTSQDQLERSNFRAYWDGQCKDGYAFGLGRDIAISDTHHLEEITVHNGTGDNVDSPRVAYDFVNNKVRYAVPGEKFPAASWFNEDIYNIENNFFISYAFGLTDSAGSNLVMEYSPLRPTRFFVNDSRNVIYKFTDNSAMPVVDSNTVSFLAEILDPKTKAPGGVAIVRYGNGQVRHVKLGGASPEAVVLPVEYVNNLSEKLKITQNALKTAQANVERARQMEREYLYMACNGKHVINGLDKEVATKICSWRSQFKDPYEKSLAKYTQDMERQKQKAEVAEQQRLAQQQIDVQQRRLQQQQSQQDYQQFANALGQFGQQMLNSVMSQPTPQVNFAPFSSQGANQIRCVNAGVVTNCRY